MNFFGRYPIETEHKELVRLINDIIKKQKPKDDNELSANELQSKYAIERLFFDIVHNALIFYRLAHTSPINRFYRARFTQENGPELALTAKTELDNKIKLRQFDQVFVDAKKYLNDFLITPFERKQKDSSFFGSRISDTSRIHYLLKQLKFYKNQLDKISEEFRTPTPINPSIQ